MFNIRKTHVALQSDSLESTRPMTYAASTPSEISALFDDIAYDKGRLHVVVDYYFTMNYK